MTNSIGNLFLFLSWCFAVTGVLSGAAGGATRSPWLTKLSVLSTQIVSVSLGISIFALAYSFSVSDFSNQYVWQYSNRDMIALYKVSAIWGGMDGSMLLWCFFHGVSAFLVSLKSSRYPEKLTPWTFSVLNGSLLFFISIVLFLTNPFRFIQAPFIPPDGNGLNPLLQNPYMAIHPPLLYLGFTTLAIPYAFCLGALLGKDVSTEWIVLTRKWTLTAWTFLTLGITLGGYWAYIELGWGGFWAWDPVENSSFMPWLTATAFLHSVMVQERKDMLRTWNIWLIVLSYLLTVFGTFLTRSGVVQSVHAFASTDVGEVFLFYLGFIFLLTLSLTLKRRKLLRSPRKIENFFSRETAFLINNLIFLSILFGTFWGVMFPIFSEAITGEKQAVGIPFFNTINVPLFLIMLFLMGVGPLIAWRQATLSQLRKKFSVPLAIAFLGGLALVWAGIRSPYAVIAYVLCLFVVLTTIGEVYRSYRTQRTSQPESSLHNTTQSLLRRHSRRYAGLLVHIGVVIATLGITSSMAYKIEREFSIAPGESYKIGRYDLRLREVLNRETPNFQALYAVVEALESRSKKLVGVLHPELRFYKKNSETTTEIALKKGIREDLYVVFAGVNESKTKASFKVYINPLQGFLWIGVGIMAIGSLLLIFTRREPI